MPDEEWGGFHRIEQALWVDQTTAGMAPGGRRAVTDLTTLRDSIPTVELEPAQIANGAVELLNEVSASKITGEEDRYSHTDLADFAANVAGAKAAFDSVSPLLADDQADLVTTIDERFDDRRRRARPPTRCRAARPTATCCTPTSPRARPRTLSAAVDALAEPLSRVAALVLQ